MFDIDFLDIPPLMSVSGTIVLPGSKSISNRVLLLAALSHGQTVVHDLLASDDTEVMLTALEQLGCTIEESADTVTIEGMGGVFGQDNIHLFMGNAGTAMRPLTAALAMLGGKFELSGVSRMHERPIGDLVDALRQLGCGIDYLGSNGFPPLQLHARAAGQLKLDKAIRVRGDVSSQFLSALLMALPLVATCDVHIEVVGELISTPYIDITLKLLARFGIHICHDNWQHFTIPAGSKYQSPGHIHVEGDASSASYFIAACALSIKATGQNCLEIQGLGSDSIQGDLRFVEAAQLMGVKIESKPNLLRIWPGKSGSSARRRLVAIDLDCNHIPDAAMTLAVMALYADGTTVLRNIASWRVKETDRLAAMATELRKLGAVVIEGADFLQIMPPANAGAWTTAPIHTYDDHRIAMCFSLAAFNPAKLPVRILDPKCVAKTFPDYFETLFSVSHADKSRIPVICIDGPTASGKGTLAQAVARRLGFYYLDSGALYRLAAVAASIKGVDLNDGPGVAGIARSLRVRFEGDKVWLDDQDVSTLIRTEQSGMDASKVSAHPEVRTALIERQHSFRALPGLVADGRDMGTVIFPDAELKIYLTASSTHRAGRRHKQLISKGNSATLAILQQDLETRDKRDTSRNAAPLKPAENAKLLDNSDLSIEQSISQVLLWWQGTRPF